MTSAKRSPKDAVVANNLRLYRVMMGKTGAQVACGIGLTYQQYFKYERGYNRISCAILWRVSCFLGIPVDDFYLGEEEEKNKNFETSTRLVFNLARMFLTLAPDDQQTLLELSRKLAGQSGGQPTSQILTKSSPKLYDLSSRARSRPGKRPIRTASAGRDI